MVDTHSQKRQSWDQTYEELKVFFDDHGHSNVPTKAGRLGMWIIRQRNMDRPKLTSIQIEKLNELKFDWETKPEKDDKMWDIMFSHLLKFIEETGHVRVPCNYITGDIPLGQWVTSQQKLHRKSKIRDDRRRRLKAVGFLWVRDERLVWSGKERTLGKTDESWNKMYQHLVEFHIEHGHCMVSVRTLVTEEHDVDDGQEGETSKKDLGTWVSRQRASYRDGTIKEDRKLVLDKIGFVWKIDHCDAEFSLRQRQWDEMCEKLKAWKKEHGHCNVPGDYKGDAALAKWVKNQRTFERNGKLDEGRFERLDVLGFVWNQIETRWKDMFKRFKTFKEKHGHCQTPVKCLDDPGLGLWVRNQRMFEKNGTLVDDEKFKLLDDLGFVWDPSSTRWNVMVNHLRDYTRAHGDVRIPDNYMTVDGTQLGWWARTQKSARKGTRKRNHLTPERIAQLDAAGFVWGSALEEQWNTMYERLKDFKEENSHTCVPQNYKCDDKPDGFHLGTWVSHQRQNRSKIDDVSLKRKERLDVIGFDWGPMGCIRKKPRLEEM